MNSKSVRASVKAGLAAAALLATPLAATAADMKLPVYKGPSGPGPSFKAMPRSVISYYNWSGFYGGLNVGYGSGSSGWDIPAIEVSPKGMNYGVTLGYNWQAGSVVYGLEGDYNLSNMSDSVVNCGGVVGAVCETKNSWFATFRGRIGYAFDRFLPYFTAGGVYGNIKPSIGPVGVSASESRLGWTVGAGLEYAFLSNWTAKIEYLYVNLGSFDTGFTTPALNKVDFDANIVRLGVNYKFSGPIGSRW